MILLINIKKKNNLYNQQGLEINNLKKNKLRNLIQQSSPITFRKVIRDRKFAVFNVNNKFLENNILTNDAKQQYFDSQCLYGMAGNLAIIEHTEPFSLSVGLPGSGIQISYRSLAQPIKLDEVLDSYKEQITYTNEDQIKDKSNLMAFPQLNKDRYIGNTFFQDRQNKILWQIFFAFKNNEETLAFLESPIGFQQFVSYYQRGRYLMVRDRRYKLRERKPFQVVKNQDGQFMRLQKSRWTLRKIQCVFVTGQTVVKPEVKIDQVYDYNYRKIIMEINRKATSNYISNLMYQYNVYESFYRTMKTNNLFMDGYYQGDEYNQRQKELMCWFQFERLHGFIHEIYSFYTDVLIKSQKDLFYPQNSNNDQLLLQSPQTQLQSKYIQLNYVKAFSQQPLSQEEDLRILYESLLHDPYLSGICSRYTDNDSIKSQNKDNQDKIFALSFDLKDKLSKEFQKYNLSDMADGYELNNILDYLLDLNDDECREQLLKLDIDISSKENFQVTSNKYKLIYDPQAIINTLNKDENKERLIGYYIYACQKVSQLLQADDPQTLMQLLNFFCNYKKKDERVNTNLAYQCTGQQTIKQVIQTSAFLYQQQLDNRAQRENELSIYPVESYKCINDWFNSFHEKKKESRCYTYKVIDLMQCRKISYMLRPRTIQYWNDNQIESIKEQITLIQKNNSSEQQPDSKDPYYYKFVYYVPIEVNGEIIDEFEEKQPQDKDLKMTSEIVKKAFGKQNGILYKIDELIKNLFGNQMWNFHLDNMVVQSLGNYNQSIPVIQQEQQQEHKEISSYDIDFRLERCNNEDLLVELPENAEIVQNIEQHIKYIYLDPDNQIDIDQILESQQYTQSIKLLEQIYNSDQFQNAQEHQLISFINNFCNLDKKAFQYSIQDQILKTAKESYKYSNLKFMKDLVRPNSRRCDIKDIIKFFEDTYNMLSCVLAFYLRSYNIQTLQELKQCYNKNQEEEYNKDTNTFNGKSIFGQIIDLIEYLSTFIHEHKTYLFHIFTKLYRKQIRNQEYDIQVKSQACMVLANTLIDVITKLFCGDIVKDTLENNPVGYSEYQQVLISSISQFLIQQQQQNQDEFM